MTLRARLLLVALALAAAALVAAQKPKPPAAAPGVPPGPPPEVRSAPVPLAPVDPAGIRDVFRFAEPEPASAKPAPRPTVPAPATPVPGLPRLSGLVRRNGRLLAAFSVNGEVVLAGEGDTAAGATVLEVSDEGVLIRLADGREERLRLP